MVSYIAQFGHFAEQLAKLSGEDTMYIYGHDVLMQIASTLKFCGLVPRLCCHIPCAPSGTGTAGMLIRNHAKGGRREGLNSWFASHLTTSWLPSHPLT